MDTGALRALQVAESLQQALAAEAKTAPIGAVELATAIVIFMSNIRKVAPEAFPYVDHVIAKSLK